MKLLSKIAYSWHIADVAINNYWYTNTCLRLPDRQGAAPLVDMRTARPTIDDMCVTLVRPMRQTDYLSIPYPSKSRHRLVALSIQMTLVSASHLAMYCQLSTLVSHLVLLPSSTQFAHRILEAITCTLFFKF